MRETWRQDFGFAFRLWSRRPLLFVIAAASIAIGIAATTAIYAVANALLFRSSPGIVDTVGLVDIGRSDGDSTIDTVSYPAYTAIRDRAQSFEGVFAYELEPNAVSLGTSEGGQVLHGTVVSGNYFQVLRVPAAAGRVFSAQDDSQSAPPFVVLSHEVWRDRFHSDPAIVGSTLKFNSYPFTVIGIAAEGFHGNTLLKNDVWFPLASVAKALPRMSATMLTSEKSSWLIMGGRLKPGTSLKSANAELATIAPTLRISSSEPGRTAGITALPLAVFPGMTEMIARFVFLLLFITALILLVACMNVSGMLIARASERRHEFAIRLAVGAERTRLIRQLLTETLVIFVFAAAFALVLSRGVISALQRLLPQLPVSISLDVPLDWRVVAFATAISFCAAMASGITPALHATRTDLLTALRLAPRQAGGAHSRLRDYFVAAQIAMSVLLVIIAVVFLHSVYRASSVDPGFRQQRVEVVSIDLSLAGYKSQNGAAALRQIVERVRALPTVDGASATADLPLDGGRMSFGPVTVPSSAIASDAVFAPDANAVEPGFFDALGISLLRGRDFNASDTSTSAPVAIVNQAFAARAWPGADPIGRTIALPPEPGRTAQLVTVVGVAADARMNSLSEAVAPYYYLPLTQQYLSRVSLVVHRRSDASVIPDVRQIVRDINRNLPISTAMPMTEVTAIQQVPQRIAAWLAGALGAVGLLLVAMGLYGIVAHNVAVRTHEIGVRMTLGASRPSILRLVLRRTAIIALAGGLIGELAGAVVSRGLSSAVAGVGSFDPVAHVTVALLLIACTLCASIVPARAAMKMNPADALRDE